uniref:Uncharacterized protein n=1 Tax=Timema shepardi TaxID=629360 RepID=A0A7R9B3I9_TIMSH|nr:unnamed protein product [Timema shepardi]
MEANNGQREPPIPISGVDYINLGEEDQMLMTKYWKQQTYPILRRRPRPFSCKHCGPLVITHPAITTFLLILKAPTGIRHANSACPKTIRRKEVTLHRVYERVSTSSERLLEPSPPYLRSLAPHHVLQAVF